MRKLLVTVSACLFLVGLGLTVTADPTPPTTNNVEAHGVPLNQTTAFFLVHWMGMWIEVDGNYDLLLTQVCKDNSTTVPSLNSGFDCSAWNATQCTAGSPNSFGSFVGNCVTINKVLNKGWRYNLGAGGYGFGSYVYSYSANNTYPINNDYISWVGDMQPTATPLQTFDNAGYLFLTNISVTVINDPPVMNSSRILPLNAVETSSAVYGYCNATDDNNDNVTYTYRWLKNGNYVTPATNTTSVASGVETLVGNYTNFTWRDEIELDCTATDWQNTSDTLRSNELKIGPDPDRPLMQNVDIEPGEDYYYFWIDGTAGSPKLGDTLQGWCNVTDDDATIDLYYEWRRGALIFYNSRNPGGED